MRCNGTKDPTSSVCSKKNIFKKEGEKGKKCFFYHSNRLRSLYKCKKDNSVMGKAFWPINIFSNILFIY